MIFLKSDLTWVESLFILSDTDTEDESDHRAATAKTKVVKNTHPNIKSTDYNSKFNEVKRIFNKIASNYLVDPAKFDFLLPRLVQIEMMSEYGTEFIITPIVSNTNQSSFIPEKPEQEQPEQKQHVNLADATIIKLVRTKEEQEVLLMRQYVRNVKKLRMYHLRKNRQAKNQEQDRLNNDFS